VDRGFGFRGAFAHISERELAGKGLWIHAKARQRILACASKQQLQLQFEEGNNRTLVEMADTKFTKLHITYDGIHFFKSPAEMSDSWDALEDDQRNAITKMSQETLIKEGSCVATTVATIHEERRLAKASAEATELISSPARIRREQRRPELKQLHQKVHTDNVKDDWGIRTISKALKETWCCDKHEYTALHQHDVRFRGWLSEEFTRLHTDLARADPANSGAFECDQLRDIITASFERNEIQLTEERREEIISAADTSDSGIFFDSNVVIDMTVGHLRSEKIIVATKQHGDLLERLKIKVGLTGGIL
jgi:hypothetical protein